MQRVFFLIGVFCFSSLHGMCSIEVSPEFRTAVEADWALQENRWERRSADPDSIRAALQRGERLIADLTKVSGTPDLSMQANRLNALREKADNLGVMTEKQRTVLYNDIRWVVRDIALNNPLIAGRKVAFMQRRRFICQMLHEYLGYYYDYRDISGGGVYVLENPGYSNEVCDLIGGRLPKGNYTTLSMSFDAKTLYFAFAERAEGKPDYYSKDRKGFHIYSMNSDGSGLRQLTDGVVDDFDPCELPDGGVAFMSTRRGGFGRCHNPWEPLPVYTLHRMNADGSGIQTLSFHETNEWHPFVLNDGRIVYTRWDYVDRSAANFHGLWSVNPDGSNPMSIFGNYTMRINACYQPHAIPGSDRIVFVAGAHHADVGGSLVIVDPKRAALNRETGEDDFSSLELLTPELCFPEGEGWPENFFHSPWPLSENYFLVSFSFDPLPGMGPKVDEDTTTGLYLFDRFGNMELLYRDEGISSMYPIPLEERVVPPSIPSSLDSDMGDSGEYMLTDINQSHFPLPQSRPIRSLRVYQILPKSETHVANKPRLGYANAESARMLLGTVPVEDDGSAYFRAPARLPLALQAVDGEGKAVQTMRSVTYVQQGERRGCVGCHEPVGTSANTQQPMAFQREASSIQPGPDGTHPWNYLRLVQPILDRRCVSCHDGKGDKQNRPNLSSESKEPFTASYESLKPYVRWYEWGGASIHPIVTRPGEMPSTVSPLVQILEGEKHKQVGLSDEEKRNLYLWMDGNAAFYGVYTMDEQIAQRQGEAIPPPKLQ